MDLKLTFWPETQASISWQLRFGAATHSVMPRRATCSECENLPPFSGSEWRCPGSCELTFSSCSAHPEASASDSFVLWPEHEVQGVYAVVLRFASTREGPVHWHGIRTRNKTPRYGDPSGLRRRPAVE